MTQAKAFSTRYEDHTGLLHMLAKRGFAAVSQTPIAASYEDIYGLMSLSFVQAQQSYDPSKGFSFSAYFGRSCWNNFLKWMNTEVRNTTAIGAVSVESLCTGEDDSANILEVVEDPNAESPEDVVQRRLDRRTNMRNLSKLGKLICRELLEPSQAVLAAVEEHNAAPNRYSVDGPTIRIIATVHGIPRYKLAEVKRELESCFDISL